MGMETINNELRPGTTLNGGQYTVLDIIGQGGFGITYRARQNKLNRTVCIKEYFLDGRCQRNAQDSTISITGTDGAMFERYREGFVKEAELVASLRHPNIVEVIDIFDDNNTSYMVMPFVEGSNLKTMVAQRGAMAFGEAMNYMAQVCEAVEYIHQRHILHRDIKPSNIMITNDYRAVLIDFGSAREFVEDKTQAHTSILTKGYAPPEQYSTVSRKGSYSDIYSLGGTLYYLLTGQDPVDAAARMTEPMPEPRELNGAIPEHVNRAIMRAMDLQPQRRQQSVREFVGELNGLTSAGHSTGGTTAARTYERQGLHTEAVQSHEPPKKSGGKAWLWILVGLGGGALLVAILMTVLNRPIPEAEEAVEATADTYAEEVEPIAEFTFDSERVRNAIDRFSEAYVNDDFDVIRQSYAPYVERFHNAYGIDREEVVDDCRRYNQTFKVYSKQNYIRWETFEMTDMGNGRAAITYLEVYSLDREDPTKPDYFLLRKHIILNSDYQIVSIYDDQIEKEVRKKAPIAQ